MDETVKRFMASKYTGTARDARMELRLFEEQRAAYNQAAAREGDTDASSWARRVLDREARRVLGEQKRKR